MRTTRTRRITMSATFDLPNQINPDSQFGVLGSGFMKRESTFDQLFLFEVEGRQNSLFSQQWMFLRVEGIGTQSRSMVNSGGGEGTFEAYIDVEEEAYLEFTTPGYWQPSGGEGQTLTGEQQIKQCTTVVKEYPKLGGQYFAQLTWSGQTLTISGTIDATFASRAIDVYNGYYCHGAVNFNSPASSAFVAPVFMDQVMGYDLQYTYEYGFGAGSQTLDFTNGLHVSNSRNFVFYGGTWDGGLFTIHLPTEYNLVGGIYTPDLTPYPDAVEFKSTDNDRDWTKVLTHMATPEINEVVVRERTLLQHLLGGTGGFYTFTDLRRVVNANGIRCWISNTGQATIGDTPDRRLLIRAPIAEVMTISQDSEFVFDDCSSASGWTNGSVVGGAIRILPSVNSGRGVKTYPSPYINSEGYAKIKFRIRSNGGDNAPITLTVKHDPGFVADKVWELETGIDGEWVEQEIDLLAPFGAPHQAYTQESRFPLSNTTLDIPGGSDNAWGINRIVRLTFQIPTSGVTNVEVDEMKFVKTSTRLTLLNSSRRHNWNTTPGSDGVFLYIALVADTDGRRSLEGEGIYTDVFGSVLTRSITQFIASCATRSGWHVAASGTLTWNQSQGMPYLGGGGALYDGSQLTSQVEIPINGTEPVYSQMMSDGFVAPPFTGDLMVNTGAYGRQVKCPIHKILRGDFCGVLITPSLRRTKGVRVRATNNVTLENAGEGTTDTLGRYRTEEPYARSIVEHEVRCLSPSDPGQQKTADVDAYHRYLRRVCFIGVPQPGGSGLHLCKVRYAGFMFAVESTGSQLLVWRFDVNKMQDDTLVALEAEGLGPAQIQAHPQGVLYIIYELDDEIRFIESWALGQEGSWSTPVTIGSGINPALAIDRSFGVEYAAVYDTDRWKLYYRDDPSGSWQYRADIAETTTDDSSAGLEVAYDNGNQLVFIYNDGGTIKRKYSMNQGKTWSEL